MNINAFFFFIISGLSAILNKINEFVTVNKFHRLLKIILVYGILFFHALTITMSLLTKYNEWIHHKKEEVENQPQIINKPFYQKEKKSE